MLMFINGLFQILFSDRPNSERVTEQQRERERDLERERETQRELNLNGTIIKYVLSQGTAFST